MNIIVDYGIFIPFFLSLLLWTRGFWKEDRGDILFSALLLLLSILLYFWIPALATVFGLPWIFLSLFAVSAAAVGLMRRKESKSKSFPAIAILASIILSALCFFGERQWAASSNAILVIAPYRHAGTWIFDDPRVGLKLEPFVSGIPEMIDKLVRDIPDAGKGFRLLFSAKPFPGHTTKLVWRRKEAGGNWYYSEEYDAEGWLCPALFKYFKRAPKEIYVKAEAIHHK